ncbi:hypothetical protein PspLS_03692 [Pyricularia sp. CBS 133598]|nr:hypothetical protein PspLS_03692 [Pyricularia sp. CBS 133598]
MSRHPAAKPHYGKPALVVHPHCVRVQPQRPSQTVPFLDSACCLQTVRNLSLPAKIAKLCALTTD